MARHYLYATLIAGAQVAEHELVHYAPADFSPRQANNGNRFDSARNMTVLVTGGAGYISSHLVHASSRPESKPWCSII